MRHRSSPALLATLAAVGVQSSGAAAQEDDDFVHGGVLGDVGSAASSNPGRIHVLGNLGLGNGDYFRGVFDDVPADRLALGPDLALALELIEDRPAPLSALTLTAGTQNEFADQVQPADGDLESWHESNNFVSLTAGLGPDWQAGLTYTLYSSPNDVSGTAHEVALAAKYGGDLLPYGLSPQAKLAVPLESEDEGAFLQLTTAPGFEALAESPHPLSVSFPVTLGLGLDDYYGSGTGETGYASVGVAASLPVPGIGSDYGSWTLAAGFDLLIRDQSLVDAGEPFDDSDNLVPLGSLVLSFAY